MERLAGKVTKYSRKSLSHANPTPAPLHLCLAGHPHTPSLTYQQPPEVPSPHTSPTTPTLICTPFHLVVATPNCAMLTPSLPFLHPLPLGSGHFKLLHFLPLSLSFCALPHFAAAIYLPTGLPVSRLGFQLLDGFPTNFDC